MQENHEENRSTWSTKVGDVTYIKAEAFSVLANLEMIDVSYNRISVLDTGFLSHNLLYINIKGNILSEVLVNSYVIEGILISDTGKLCCVLEVSFCVTPIDVVPSCSTLLRYKYLNAYLSFTGMIILFMNIGALLYNSMSFFNSTGNVNKTLTFKLTNILYCCDTLCGMYILLLVLADSIYEKSFLVYEFTWKNSYLCFFLNVIAITYLCISPVLVVMISLARLHVVKDHTNRGYNVFFQATILICITMIHVPTLFMLRYSENTQSAICLLFLSSKHTPARMISVAFLILSVINLLIVMPFAYINIFFHYKTSKQKVGEITGRKEEQKRKLVEMILLTVMPHIISGLTILVVIILCLVMADNTEIDIYILFIFPCFALIDPTVYTFNTKKFKTQVLGKFNCINLDIKNRV